MKKIFSISRKVLAYLGVYIITLMVFIGLFSPQTPEETWAVALLVIGFLWGIWGIGVVLE
jgi:hypothetical protein